MKRKVLQYGFVLALGLSAAGCWLGGSDSKPKAAPAPVVPMQAERVQRGKYLVTVMSCSDCHTPFKMTDKGPMPDETRAFSGHPAGFKITSGPDLGKGPWVWAGTGTNTAFAGPWGVSFAMNLTPDKVSGMGIWDEARFVKTMRTGKHFGEARPILPPMPWQGLSQATDEDLKSMWAYLQTLPPISNEVPAALPPAGGPPKQ